MSQLNLIESDHWALYESVTAGGTGIDQKKVQLLPLDSQFADSLLDDDGFPLHPRASSGEVASRVFFDIAKLFSTDVARKLYREVVWHRLHASHPQVRV